MADNHEDTGGPDEAAVQLAYMAELMNKGSPQASSLGFHTLEISPGRALVRVKYREDLIGDPATGVIAGGVVTTLLDHTCGQAVYAGLKKAVAIATLDLRIDYMRRSEPGLDVFVAANVYKWTHSIAFVRAIAYDRDPQDPVAAAQAAFMLDASAGRPPGANLKPPARGSAA